MPDGRYRHKKARNNWDFRAFLVLLGCLETLDWWRRRELNPRPSVLCLWLYMFSIVDCLTSYRPTCRVYSASPVIFGETAPDRHFHDPVLYDNCDHWFTGIPVAIVSGP